ncbi:ferrichrome outer membrane transporter [Escherichia coli]|uniref:Ferrichrome outer membrane transporter n=1 Tax=Escherichia coli TaxID=562 RepID=A0A2X1JLW1_ECOLX|nr:ferrichrome outer membrane transporter [Escherichia coli]
MPKIRQNSGPYRILNKQKQTGVYVQDQAQWDKVLVTLGGRYDWADQESLNRVAGTTDKRDDKQFTCVVVLTTCLIMV